MGNCFVEEFVWERGEESRTVSLFFCIKAKGKSTLADTTSSPLSLVIHTSKIYYYTWGCSHGHTTIMTSVMFEMMIISQ